MNTISENQRGSVFLCCLGTLRRQTFPTEGVLHQTTPMTYAASTKTCRRKSMSPMQFRSSPTHLAIRPMEKALQNLGSKTVILTNTNTGNDEGCMMKDE